MPVVGLNEPAPGLDESFWVYQEKEVAVLFVVSVMPELPHVVIVESVTSVVPCRICDCAKLFEVESIMARTTKVSLHVYFNIHGTRQGRSNQYEGILCCII